MVFTKCFRDKSAILREQTIDKQTYSLERCEGACNDCNTAPPFTA